GVRRLGHRFGQFIDPIVEVRAVLAKLLEQGDHLGDILLTQDRQLQIEGFPTLCKASVSSLRREDQDDQIEGRQRRCAPSHAKGGGSSARNPRAAARPFKLTQPTTKTVSAAMKPALPRSDVMRSTTR